MFRYIYIYIEERKIFYISQKKALGVFKKLREFKNILSDPFIYEPILMKIDMNADNINI